MFILVKEIKRWWNCDHVSWIETFFRRRMDVHTIINIDSSLNNHDPTKEFQSINPNVFNVKILALTMQWIIIMLLLTFIDLGASSYIHCFLSHSLILWGGYNDKLQIYNLTIYEIVHVENSHFKWHLSSDGNGISSVKKKRVPQREIYLVSFFCRVKEAPFIFVCSFFTRTTDDYEINW